MRTLRRATLVALLAVVLVLGTASSAFAARTLHVSASISNHHPNQYTTVTAHCKAKDQNGKAIKGVKCVFTWHYKTVSHSITRYTNSAGRATNARYISGATVGFKVWIRIRCTWKGQVKKCSTWFIPQ